MSLIIDQPNLVSWPRRIGWGFVTFAFWLAWTYLWLPLLTVVAWSIGIYEVFEYVRWYDEALELKRLISIYMIVIAAMGGALLLWALSEYLRFRNKNRRTARPPATEEELADYLGVPVQSLQEWQGYRSVVAFHDEHGDLIDVQYHTP